MNYRFIKKDLDTYKLAYTNIEGKDVEIEFKRTIELASRLQGILSEARVKMFKELSKLGITKNDLIVRKDDGNGHITYDETNYQEYEKYYLQIQEALILNEIIEKLFKKNIQDLFKDMGIDKLPQDKHPKELENFGKQLGTIINKGIDDTPSAGNTEEKE